MLRDCKTGKLSLNRMVFAASSLVSLLGALNYIYNAGPDVVGLIGVLIGLSGAGHVAREHTKKQEAT